ncbi:MAG TPA: site-specific integrase [Candidatus Sumerlaeota bacterium]|nr:site-specific integrase [Candidatus Sumerlaeota bacterium]
MQTRQTELNQLNLGLKESRGKSSPLFSKAASGVVSESSTTVGADWTRKHKQWTKAWITINGNLSINAYTPDDARRYIATRREEFVPLQKTKEERTEEPKRRKTSDATIRKEAMFLARVFRQGGNDIFVGIRRPAESKGEIHYLTAEQFACLVASAPPDRKFRYVFLACTGARRSEAWRVTWRDVDLVNGSVLIRNAQKGAGPRFPFRKVPIPQMLLPYLKYYKGDENELVFPTHQNWRRRLLYDCAKAKIAPCRIHDLRHTYASWLVQSGTSLQVVRDLMGHASITTTERYAHLAPDANKTAAAAIDAHRAKPPAKIEEVG